MLLNEDHCLIQQSAKQLADRAIRPFTHTWDVQKQFPTPALQALKENGFMGMLMPPEWGGAGLDYLGYVLVCIEIARADASVATIVSVHNSVASLPILHEGTHAQKEQWLRPLACGEKLGAFALSEPEAGSDAKALRSRAIRQGDQYILTGTKQFVTSGQHADLVIVFAMLPEGISAFIVPTQSAGYHVAKIENKMGQHAAETVQIIFDNLVLPADALLGKPGEGYKIALRHLESGRLGIAAQAIGIAEEALSHSVRYAKERRTFGKLLCEHQAIRFTLADMATRLEAAKQLLFHAAMKHSQGLSGVKEASMAKLFATESAEYICREAIQIHGGYGYLADFPLERLYRDVRVTTIYEGTSEIQREVIGRVILQNA